MRQLINWKFSSDYYKRSLKSLEIALGEIPLYKTWHSLDPGPNHSIDSRYAAMLATTKKDIRENFPGGILPNYRDVNLGLSSGEIQLVETSGTTNDRISNIWNQKWWDESERASWKLNSTMAEIAVNEFREAILVNPRNVGFISDDEDLPMEKRLISRFLYLNEKTNPLLWTSDHMDRIIEELSVFQPAVLEANPSYLARLCRYVTTNNKRIFQPQIIMLTYEYPTNFHYYQIKCVFPVPMASSYGTTETGYVFMQCEKGKFHQNMEFCRVDFQPLKARHGGPNIGRILVTPFQNPWNYIVRFYPGDLAGLEESGKCSCGRNSGLILSSMNGREINLTLTCTGRLVTLFELDTAISILKNIDEYQLIQTNNNTYNLYLVSQRSDKEKLGKEASEILKNIYGREARVFITYKDAIVPESSGKYLVSKAMFPIELNKYLDEKL
ncbi:MAG: hypothetical protein NTV30_04430 [Chloroflexi bacterium]|nr:hypothetical protein [Chloroflexota bacterium]